MFVKSVKKIVKANVNDRSRHLQLPLGSQTYTGDLTYYGTGLGACGVVAHDDDDIVSISHYTFDAVSKGSNPNANPLCGHKIRTVRDGNSVDLTVVDRCRSRREGSDGAMLIKFFFRCWMSTYRYRRESWSLPEAGKFGPR